MNHIFLNLDREFSTSFDVFVKNQGGKMKTIAAIATAQGLAGIGVIRISGDKSKEIVDKVFKSVSGKKLSEMKGYTASYGKIMEN